MRFAAALIALAAATLPVVLPAATSSEVCVIDDARATELSGLVATPTGYIAINDSQWASDAMHIVFLSPTCGVLRTLSYPTSARDPEDLAVAPDGTVWVADIGDNVTAQSRRQTVALWQVPADGAAPVVHRLTYPDGPHDAEALLFDGDGAPLIVTKETDGIAGIYRPTGPLQPRTTAGVPMQRVGQFTPVSSGENNHMGMLGEVLVTGGAMSPDRRKVVLRTYTAAYEWDVADGDVVKAITASTPRLTGLPDEPQGEAISYSADGSAFLTVSDELGPTVLRLHVPSVATLQTPPPSGDLVATPESDSIGGIPIWLAITAGVLGLAVAVVGYLGLRRSRTRTVV